MENGPSRKWRLPVSDLMNNFEAPVFERGYPDFDAVNRKEEESFEEMGIDINLNGEWDDE